MTARPPRNRAARRRLAKRGEAPAQPARIGWKPVAVALLMALAAAARMLRHTL